MKREYNFSMDSNEILPVKVRSQEQIEKDRAKNRKHYWRRKQLNGAITIQTKRSTAGDCPFCQKTTQLHIEFLYTTCGGCKRTFYTSRLKKST